MKISAVNTLDLNREILILPLINIGTRRGLWWVDFGWLVWGVNIEWGRFPSLKK